MPRSRLDALLPGNDFSERHSRRVAAAPSAAIGAVKAVTLAEVPLVRLLFALRSPPGLVGKGRGLPSVRGRPLYEQMVEHGFLSLAEEEDEVVLGYVGQPLEAGGRVAPEPRIGGGVAGTRRGRVREGGAELPSGAARER